MLPVDDPRDYDPCYYHGPVLCVLCWCEAAVVLVKREDLAAGKTGSCGHPGCEQPEAA